jgi:hypothetical protein
VASEKAQREAWLGGTSGAASSFGRGCDLGEYRAGVIEKGATCRGQFDATSAPREELRAYLVLKISNLAT